MYTENFYNSPNKRFKKSRNKEFDIPDFDDYYITNIFDDGSTFDFPSLQISQKAHNKMWSLIDVCDIEITWYCLCDIDEKTGDIVLSDVIVPYQECSGATVDISAKADAMMQEELFQQGRIMDINRIKCWGHSHVKMNTTASSTDEEQTDKFMSIHNDYFVRIIGNKYKELAANIYLIDKNILISSPPITVIGDCKDNNEYHQWAKDTIEEKVTKKSFATYYKSSNSKNAIIPYRDNYNNINWQNWKNGDVDKDIDWWDPTDLSKPKSSNVPYSMEYFEENYDNGFDSYSEEEE